MHRDHGWLPAGESSVIVMALSALVGTATTSAQTANRQPLRQRLGGRPCGSLGLAGPRREGSLTPAGGSIVRHPVIAGTAIGAGAGLALAQIDAIGGREHDPRVALIGAGGGAWGGLIASAVQHARAGKRIGIGTKVGIVAGAVGLVVLPALACYGAGGCGGSS